MADIFSRLKDAIPVLAKFNWPSHLLTWIGVIFAGFGFVTYFWPSSNASLYSSDSPSTPKIKPVTFGHEHLPYLGEGRSVFVLHFRNDAESSAGDAFSVVAHIGYRSREGANFLVNYGAWIENSLELNIERAQTKRLIFALADLDGKIFCGN